MSENPEGKSVPVEQGPDAQLETPRRRLFIFKAVAVLTAAAAVVLGTAGAAHADVGAGHQDRGGSTGNDSYRRRRRWRRRR